MCVRGHHFQHARVSSQPATIANSVYGQLVKEKMSCTYYCCYPVDLAVLEVEGVHTYVVTITNLITHK